MTTYKDGCEEWLEKIRNKYIRDSTRVTPTVDEIKENRSRWLGRVLKSEEIEAARVTKEMATVGKRTKEKKKVVWCDRMTCGRLVCVMNMRWSSKMEGEDHRIRTPSSDRILLWEKEKGRSGDFSLSVIRSLDKKSKVKALAVSFSLQCYDSI